MTTILFSQDWLKHRGATVHYNTTNPSFLKLAEVYHRMGVKNNVFHLALLNPQLANVDPYAPDLPLKVQGMIAQECKLNFWYYLREIERIPTPGSTVATKFQANRMNIALYWLYFNHVMTIAVILRQNGKTTTITALGKYLLNFGTLNNTINLLTKSEGLKAETLLRLKAMYNELPPYLNFSSRGDLFNTEMVHLKAFQNKFQGHLSSASEKQADKVGRGFVSPTSLVDEACFVENIETAVAAMLMSGNFARRAAEKAGHPFGTLFTTTAGDIDDRDGGFIYELATGATLWDEKYYDSMDLKSLNEIIYKNCTANKNGFKRPMVHLTLSYLQLGLDDEWLRKTLEENVSTPENLARDLFNQWRTGSKRSPIDKHLLDILRQHECPTAHSEFYAPYNHLLRWSIDKEEVGRRIQHNHSFIIGVDTSDGSGGDDISFVVRDHVIGDVICVTTFNEINLITVADMFFSFMMDYPNTMMNMERKSSAAALIDFMILKFCAAGINPFTRMYNTIFQNKEQYKKEYEAIIRARPDEVEVFTTYKKHIGFVTSGSGVTSRSELYSTTLNHMLKFTASVTRDPALIKQISSLVIINNRIDHPAGGNDDLVIGALLSYWVLINGRNLHLYGIDTSSILRNNTVYLKEKYKNEEDEYDHAEMMALEAEFNRLLDDYRAERNPILAQRLELKIKHIAGSIRSDSNIVSVEELLSNIAREKRVTRL
ncbi:MAG: hypothetical protein PHN51_10340 [Candidatus Nanopelagicales bacterium]|nr:hypothetical protein [Candidatus Nanopelagicales bacterium]